jgi:hypothetical protein
MDSQTLGTIASFVRVVIIFFNWRSRGRWTRADHLPQVRLEEEKRRHSRGNDALQELKDAPPATGLAPIQDVIPRLGNTTTLLLGGPGLSGKTTIARRVGWRFPTREEAASAAIDVRSLPRRIIVQGHAADLVYSSRGGPIYLPAFDQPWSDPRLREGAMHICAVARGALFIVDSQHERLEADVENLETLRRDLEYVGQDVTRFPLVFALNKRDLPNVMTKEELQSHLRWPICDYVETCARRDEGIETAFLRLFELIAAHDAS